jgi:hypothetical protein
MVAIGISMSLEIVKLVQIYKFQINHCNHLVESCSNFLPHLQHFALTHCPQVSNWNKDCRVSLYDVLFRMKLMIQFFIRFQQLRQTCLRKLFHLNWQMIIREYTMNPVTTGSVQWAFKTKNS